MATVYRVRHTVLGSLHALKVLNHSLIVHSEIRERFLFEGRIQSQLHHPNIVMVTDLVSEPGIAGLVMEYIDGPSLETWLQEQGPVAEETARELLLGMLGGIGAAHARDVVHRDIKPANVILTTGADGVITPKVIDFGIAKFEHAHEKKRTRAGTRMGTVAYMSPEQIHGQSDIDGRSDIWALGVILYEMLTGRHPFDVGDDFETMQRIDRSDYTPVEKARPDVSMAMRQAIAGALQRSPEARHANAVAFRRALGGASTHPGVALSTVPRPLSPQPARPQRSTTPRADQRSGVPLSDVAAGPVSGPDAGVAAAQRHPAAGAPTPASAPRASIELREIATDGWRLLAQCFFIAMLARRLFYYPSDLWVANLLSLGGGLFLGVRMLNKQARETEAIDSSGTARLYALSVVLHAICIGTMTGSSLALDLSSASDWFRTFVPQAPLAAVLYALATFPARRLASPQNRAALVDGWSAVLVCCGLLVVVDLSTTETNTSSAYRYMIDFASQLLLQPTDTSSVLLSMNDGFGERLSLLRQAWVLLSTTLAVIMLTVIRRALIGTVGKRRPAAARVASYLGLLQLAGALVVGVLGIDALANGDRSSENASRIVFDLVQIAFHWAMAERSLRIAGALDPSVTASFGFADKATRPLRELLDRL